MAYEDLEQALKTQGEYYQTEAEKAATRAFATSRARTAGILPETIGRMRTEYGLGMGKQIGELRASSAEKAWQESMQFGGYSPFSRGTIKGQLPFTTEFQAGEATKQRTWQTGESALQREWQRRLQEDQWKVQKEIAEQQAWSNIISGITGGIGSILGGGLGAGGFFTNILSKTTKKKPFPEPITT